MYNNNNISVPSIFTVMNNISTNIQHVFEEIVKQLVRKIVSPIAFPPNRKPVTIYNNYLQRYERAVLGSSYNDSVDKYNYFMTHESIGWNNDVFANFKLIPRFTKSHSMNQKNKKEKIPFINHEHSHSENKNPPIAHQYAGKRKKKDI